MTENSLVTGRVFTKLFFSFVVVLFLGMTVLDFSLRQVMEQSLHTQVDESLASEARLLAAHITASASPAELQQIARTDAAAAQVEVGIFDAQGRMVANSGSGAGTNSVPPEVAAVLFQHRPVGHDHRAGTEYVAVPAGPL